MHTEGTPPFFIPPSTTFGYISVTERICKNYRLGGEQADVGAEWPTRYSYLLYEMFSAITGWVSALRDIPLEQSNVKLKFAASHQENGNIPKSSILALSRCLKRVLVEPNIPVRVRQYLLDTALSLYFTLREDDRLHPYAEAMRVAIGTCTIHECRDRTEYFNRLIDGIEGLDRITYQPEHVDQILDFVKTERMKNST